MDFIFKICDVLIFFASTTIAFILLYFSSKRKDVPFLPIFWLFAAFIFFCGLTHLIEATIFYHPWYRLSGMVKLLTVLVSWGTVVALCYVTPEALKLPGLKTLNLQLQREIEEHKLTQSTSEGKRNILEATIEKGTESLKRSNLDLEQFAYAASHDLQEPLRAVSGFCQLLQINENNLSDSSKEYLQHAIDGADRMRSLIAGLLEFSRVSSTNQTMQEIDMKEVVVSVKENLVDLIQRTNTKLVISNMPIVYANKIQMMQIFQNLISNGIKYNKNTPIIDITHTEAETHHQFTVSDNGIGIDEKNQSRIFGIFSRLHTRQEYDGMGMELSICKRIVERHNGRIWVESELGKGSKFHFTIEKRYGKTN